MPNPREVAKFFDEKDRWTDGSAPVNSTVATGGGASLKDDAWADEPLPAVVIGGNSLGYAESDRLVKAAPAINKMHRTSKTVAVTQGTNGSALAQAFDGRWDEFTARVVALDLGYIVQYEPGESINRIGWFGHVTQFQVSRIGKVHVFKAVTMDDYEGRQLFMIHNDLPAAFGWLETEEEDKRNAEAGKAKIARDLAAVNEELARGPKRAEAQANADKLAERVAELEAIIKKAGLDGDA